MNLLSKNLNQQMMLQQLPDITFLAEALDEPFIDICVITLRAHTETKVKQDSRWLDRTIEDTIDTKQFIRVDSDRIVIAIDVEKVDDKAVDEALLSFMEADLSTGYCEFGETITYNSSELLNDTYIH